MSNCGAQSTGSLASQYAAVSPKRSRLKRKTRWPRRSHRRQKDSKKLKTGAAEENRSAGGDLRAAFQIASNAKGVSGKDAAKVKSDNSISDYCNRLQPGELGILKRNDSKCPACRGAQQALRAPLCKYSRR